MVLVLVFNSVVKICAGFFGVFFWILWVPEIQLLPAPPKKKHGICSFNKVSTEIGAPKMFVLTKDTS